MRNRDCFFFSFNYFHFLPRFFADCVHVSYIVRLIYKINKSICLSGPTSISRILFPINRNAVIYLVSRLLEKSHPVPLKAGWEYSGTSRFPLFLITVSGTRPCTGQVFASSHIAMAGVSFYLAISPLSRLVGTVYFLLRYLFPQNCFCGTWPLATASFSKCCVGGCSDFPPRLSSFKWLAERLRDVGPTALYHEIS